MHGLLEGSFGKIACLLLREQVEDSILITDSVYVALFILAADARPDVKVSLAIPGLSPR